MDRAQTPAPAKEAGIPQQPLIYDMEAIAIEAEEISRPQTVGLPPNLRPFCIGKDVIARKCSRHRTPGLDRATKDPRQVPAVEVEVSDSAVTVVSWMRAENTVAGMSSLGFVAYAIIIATHCTFPVGDSTVFDPSFWDGHRFLKNFLWLLTC